MNPSTSIPPTRIVRRVTRKRWHIVSSPRHQLTTKDTLCGQRLRSNWKMTTAYNAAQITCDDCLVEAISRGGAKR